MSRPRFMSCPDCGASVDRATGPAHRCDPVRQTEFELLALRRESETFEDGLHQWLETVDGRFETWLAVRRVRGAA